MPAQWVVREVQAAMQAAMAAPLATPEGVTAGRRVFIFDGYPRSMNDLREFEQHIGVSASSDDAEG